MGRLHSNKHNTTHVTYLWTVYAIFVSGTVRLAGLLNIGRV